MLELKWTYRDIEAATVSEILDANEALDVQRDIDRPPAPLGGQS